METGLVASDLEPIGIEQVQRRINTIQKLMKASMIEGTHFGKIPGCGEKPALLKPGAELLCVLFQLQPSFEIREKDLGGGHKEFLVITTISHRGFLIAQGLGSCSTLESKFRYRDAARKCPQCGKEAIIKGKAEYGGGFLCFAKKGGCGAKFKDKDPAIEGQQIGRIENPDPADCYNTVLKMAKKRSHVDGTITATGCSDIFTQDIDESVEIVPSSPQPTAKIVPADDLPPPVTFRYSPSKVPEEKLGKFHKLCQDAGAVWSDDDCAYVSAKKLTALQEFEVVSA